MSREGEAIAVGAVIPSGRKTAAPLATLPLAHRSYWFAASLRATGTASGNAMA